MAQLNKIYRETHSPGRLLIKRSAAGYHRGLLEQLGLLR